MTQNNSLPDGWKWVKLDEISELSGGGTPSRENPDYFKGDIVWLTPTEIPKNRISVVSNSKEMITKQALKNSSARILPKGTVLMTSRASIGYVAIAGAEVTTNQGFASFSCKKDVYNYYLAYWLLGNAEFFKQEATGTTFKEISKSKLRTFSLPLPPLPEQERIVAKIEELFTQLDAGTAALRRVQAQLKRYKNIILNIFLEGRGTYTEVILAQQESNDFESGKDLLERILSERRKSFEEEQQNKGKVPIKINYEEPISPEMEGLPVLPKEWCWASLEQLTSGIRVICYGILMPKEHIEDGVPYVKVKDFKGEVIDINNLQRTSKEIAEKYKRASLKAGDLLLAIRGTYGRVVEVPPSLEGANITQDTARLSPSQFINCKYLEYFLRSQYCQDYFKKVARGVAVKGVNIGDVRLCPIALPPLQEQNKIVIEVERRLSLAVETEALVKAALARSARLRQSILKRAFEGKLLDQGAEAEAVESLAESARAVENFHNERTIKQSRLF